MAVQTVANTRIKGVRWLAELYKNRQVDAVTAQTLNKLVDLEVSHLRLQLEDMERVLADYERHYGMASADFFVKFEAGQLGDNMDLVEWSGLFQMAGSVRKQLQELDNEG